jgi:hypothetical protein
MENEDNDGIREDGPTGPVPPNNNNGQGNENLPPSDPEEPEADLELTKEERAVILWFLEHAHTLKGPHWAWIIATLKMAAALLLASGVAVGLGDGNEFDDVGCSVAQKPNAALRKTHSAEREDQGLDDSPGPGAGRAVGYWDECADVSGDEFDLRPACISGAKFCPYRLPDGFCPVRRARCRLLAGPPGDTALSLEEVMRMLRQVDGKVDVWAAGSQQLKQENEVLRQANAALAKMQAEGLLTFVQKIDAETFQQGVTVLVHGDVAKAARALGMSDSTLRSKIARWPKRGKAYAALADVVRWRKAIKGEAGAEIAKRVASGVERDVDYPALLRDVIEELGMLDPDNWEERTASLAETLRRAVG